MLKLEIITPEKLVLQSEVDSVTVPTATGEAGILPNHAPLISALKPGVLAYTSKGSINKLAVSSGFVEINNDSVSVLVDRAETADEIDLDAARGDKETAEKAIAARSTAPIEETESLHEDLESAQTRLHLAAGK